MMADKLAASAEKPESVRSAGKEILVASNDDVQSTVESYKKRYNSHMRNPLIPAAPSDLIVGIPPKHPA